MAQAGHNLPLIIATSCVATLGGFLFGFDSGVINGTIDGLQSAFNSNSIGTGFNVASMLLGCAIGAFFAGVLADKFGRRTLLIVSALFFIVSAWGSGIADTGSWFILYRVLGGLAVGAASVMAPAYISEIAPSEYRGRLSSVQQVAIICGLSAAFFSNYLLADAAGGSKAVFWLGYEAWRWMFWIELVPAALFAITLLLISESPRYLVLTGQQDKARQVLDRLAGTDQAPKLIQEISDSLADDHHAPRLSDLFQAGKVRRIVWIGIGLATFQQLVGINVVFYYGSVLWQSVGFSENDALQINVLSGLLSIGAVVAALLLIDRIGRKPLLMIGSIGMAATLAVVAYAFATGSLQNGTLQLSDQMGVVALIAANTYVVFFNFSWGPVMWVMLGEMFPNQIRGTGLAVSGLFQWGSNFAVTMTFPYMLAGIGLAATYGIYAFFATLSIWFVASMIRETRGISLEDMRG
ncbi:sugar porter family MFS transporter [Arenicella xantha]|uniref:D-xylose-proton symporter n=1 Tax=Arenicella xantha TaxID=644221 RepID=A0A395JIQ6_9GAMM|nr:sugar porter family MFS transporter [Arenicella xantha]RBP49753.1 SP family sugar:H+ symporter-like MFS transporter [Arenicella xantha]